MSNNKNNSTQKKKLSISFLGAFVLFTSFFLVAESGGKTLRFDTSFNPAVVFSAQGDFAYVNDIKEQSDGKVVIAGWYKTINGTSRNCIARVKGDGSLDTTFNPGSGVDNGVKRIALQSTSIFDIGGESKVIIAGYFSTVNGASKSNIARLNEDGSVDNSFGASVNSTIWDMDNTGGNILIGGQFYTVNATSREEVARLFPDGSIDASFNPGSGVTSGGGNHWVRAVANVPISLGINPLDKVLVGGDFTSFNNTARNRIVRLNNNGSVDTTFNIGSGFNDSSIVTDIVVQPDGKYLVGGSFISYNGTARQGIVRLLSSGTLDPDFVASVSGGYGEVDSIALQEDGRIVIGGNFHTVNGMARMNIARLNPDGSLDMDFNPGAGTDDTVNSVVTTEQGQVLIGGRFSLVDDEDRIHIARYNEDPSMGGGAANPYTLFAGGKDDWKQISLPRPTVNTGTLDLVTEGSLYHLSTLGPPIYVRLSYNSNTHKFSSGSFGSRWSFLYESSILPQSTNQVKLRRGVGIDESYTSLINLNTATPSAPVVLSSTKGTPNKLICYGTYWIYTEKDTSYSYRFDSQSIGLPAYLTTITDRNNNSLTISADLSNGKVQQITDSSGRDLNFVYTDGRCTRITVPDGRTIEFRYDSFGQLLQIKDMIGYLGKYTYDEEGYMTYSDLGGLGSTGGKHKMRFTYENKIWSSGKYVSTIQALSGKTQITPQNGSINEVQWTNPSGHVTVVKTQNGKTAGVVDPAGVIRSLSYVEGLPKSYTGGEGNITKFTHDTNGNLSSVTDALGARTSYFYDTDHNLTRRQDAKGKSFFYGYDSKGNLLKIRFPNAMESNFTYTSKGQLWTYTNGAGKVTRYTYDSYGNILTLTAPDSGVVTHHFSINDKSSRCYKITDSRGNVKNYSYDDNNRVIRISYGANTPADATIYYQYDAIDLLSVTNELGKKNRVERNEYSQIVKSYDPLNNLTQFKYDANGNLIQLTNPLRQVLKTAYDGSSRPIETTDPLNRVTKRTFDGDGNLLSIRDARFKTTKFTYDANNRLKSIINPLEQTITKTYDSLGNEIETENSRGGTVGLVHDSLGNIISKDHDGSVQATYTFDSSNRLQSSGHTTYGTKSYTYDDNGRTASITWPDSTTVSYTYDTEGNLLTLTYPDGLVISYAYDSYCRRKLPASLRHGPIDDISPQREKSNQVTSMAWTGGSLTFQYDKTGKPLVETRSNDTETTYQYDPNQRTIGINHTSGGTALLTIDNQYNAAGRRIFSTNNQTLISPVPENAHSLSYDDANQLLAYASRNYTYDDDGNVTAIGSIFSASYDAESRPVSITSNGVGTTLGFDSEGYLYKSTRSGVNSYYHIDRKGRLLFITNQSGAITSRFIYRGKRLVAQQDSGNQWHFYHFDSRGNTLAMTDSSGTKVAEYAYSPHGLYTQQGTPPFNPFSFVGRFGVLDQGDSIYLMTNRLYLAGTGRFLQRDPLGLTGGLNLYAYAGNNPIGNIDPQGTFEADPEEYEPPEISEGTADLDTNELPYYTDEGFDSEDADEFVDDYAKLYGSIPGLPYGNYLNAARAAKRGDYATAGWEACKGATGCIPVAGTAINISLDVGEIICKAAYANCEKNRKEDERIAQKRKDSYKPKDGPKRADECQMLGDCPR